MICFTGAKEIDIAATLEHLRDQRPGMVQTKVYTHAYTQTHNLFHTNTYSVCVFLRISLSLHWRL